MNNNFEFKDWSGFRPLSGSYISQLGHLFIGAEMGGGFRPLSGSYISQSSSVYSEKAAQPVSVPYRGATFLNAQGHVLSAYRRKLFPSPIGELHFSISKENLNRQRYVVSVPYRGATFLNEEHLRLRERLSLSFRPLSGSYISQSFLFSPFISQLCECFRPLSGSYISQSRKQVLKNVETIVSVPYRGATFLNDNSTIQGLMDTSFPSPIGELHFSIKRHKLKSGGKT